MPKKTQPVKPFKKPSLVKPPEIKPDAEPEEPIIPEEDPEIIPDEDLDETPPYETPPPGEGP